MNPVHFLLIAAFLTGGAVADCYWLVSTEGIVREIRARESPVIGGAGIEARWWIEDRRNRVSVRAALGKDSGLAGFRARLRIDGRESSKYPGVSPTVEIGTGQIRFLAGPARGGMGSGLLFGEELWNTAGSGVRGAWGRVPTGLRAGPVSAGYDRPQVIALQSGDRRRAALAFLRGTDGTRYLAVEWRPSDTLRTVLVRSGDFLGTEFTVGAREGGAQWRIGIAAWKGRRDGGGSSAEASASVKGREVDWETRLWYWYGARSPLAPPPEGAAEDRRQGCRMAVAVQPADRVSASASIETAMDGDTRPGSLWWRSQFLVTSGLTSGTGLQLRFRRTEGSAMEPWMGLHRQVWWSADLRLRSSQVGCVRWYGGLQRRYEATHGHSDGIRIQAEYAGVRLKGYLHGIFSVPINGIPLYWFEPGPAYGWNLRTETGRAIRVLLGILDRTGRWHIQLMADHRGSLGFKAAWRFGRVP